MPKIIEEATKQILIAAKKELAEQGVELFTMRSVAQKANMAVGTLYHYFPDKTTLLATILFEDWDKRIKALTTDLRSVPTCEDGVIKIILLIRTYQMDFQNIFDTYRTNEFSENYIRNHPLFIKQVESLWLILKERFNLKCTDEESEMIAEMITVVSKSPSISSKTLNSIIQKITSKEN